MKKNRIETRKTEERYITADPAKMAGKYIARRVIRRWTEEFVDKTNGEVTSIERAAIEFDAGTYIDNKVLASIRFWQTEGSIREIEVSNQKRMGIALESSGLIPHKARVEIRGKKTHYLFYATDIANAIEILTDYLELNTSSGFLITKVEEFEKCMILTDNLISSPDASPKEVEEELNGEAHESREHGFDEEERDSSRRFYMLNVKIVEVDKAGKEADNNYGALFIVETYSAIRANLIITKWLCDRHEEARRMAARHPERTFVDREIASYIEESKIISVGEFIPREFSQAYLTDGNNN